ncbi:MAG: folate-binding protein [Rudaea sp.]|uniref:CAF17-like 4Fe-4S cluster assembly/insertion protein YgfZ n=1 Tax=Rudaea sp. TaxID=2136325 RepID=UPI0039E271B8
MTSAPLVALPAVHIVDISGADAIAFAQAQFSSNLAELPDGHWQWSAWLSAQGRVRAFFHLLRDDAAHLRLVLRGGTANALRDALARYVLRAKVTLGASEYGAFIERETAAGIVNPESPNAMRIERDGGRTALALPGEPRRRLVLCDSGSVPADADDSDEARNANALADIDAGLVTLDPALEDKLLPAWIGLDTLGATSTNKGCYPGQEIVARLHFKGGNKRWLHRIAFSAERLPAPGTALEAEGGEAGFVVCSAWTGTGAGAALAVLGERGAGHLQKLSSLGLGLLSAEKIGSR